MVEKVKQNPREKAKTLTDKVGGEGGRAQRSCVPLRICTPPDREGDIGWG